MNHKRLKEKDLEAVIWSPIVSLFREDFLTDGDYYKAVKQYKRHYGYKALVTGGWKFFEFENDYITWRNQS